MIAFFMRLSLLTRESCSVSLEAGWALRDGRFAAPEHSGCRAADKFMIRRKKNLSVMHDHRMVWGEQAPDADGAANRAFQNGNTRD